jgi:hypothetical protein
MAPLGVPEEETLLERSQVVIGLLRNAFEGKSLSSLKDTVETSNDWKRGLLVVCNGCLIAVGKLEVGLVPLEDISSGLALCKKDLGTEETNLESREEVSFTFDNGDAAGIIQDLVSETTPFVGDELSRNAIHGKGNVEINKGTRHKVCFTRADGL